MEYREFRAESVSVDGSGKLHGVAVPFNRETAIGDPKKGGWREEVAPGAAKKSVQEGDIVFLAHHDMHMPLARMSAGNLSLEEAGDSLRYEVDPVDTSYGRDIRKLADAKVLGGVSIGFRPIKDEWRDDDGNPSDKFSGTHRILREIQLIEISAVTNPAYKDTSIMARDELLAERETRAEERAVSAADRDKAHAAGNSLPDKSYPINNVHQLHAAAVLAASHHGDWQAAKALIRRRAKELGVDVNTLPGFGEKKSADDFLAAYDELADEDRDALPEGLRAAFEALREERSDQEPDASTPESDNDDLALRMRHRQNKERSRKLGIV